MHMPHALQHRLRRWGIVDRSGAHAADCISMVVDAHVDVASMQFLAIVRDRIDRNFESNLSRHFSRF